MSDDRNGRDHAVDSEVDIDAEERVEDIVDDVLDDWEVDDADVDRETADEIARQSLVWLRNYDGEASEEDVPVEEFTEGEDVERMPDSVWSDIVRDAWEHAANEEVVERSGADGYRLS